ncbi:MAG: glycosyltransferase [Bacteroidaceae bacterium]|nr:glycosyltransferase [Bacteroidaceae bacterium]
MNILYISHLVVQAESGPTWSVPASINAQSRIDNVLWVNTSKGVMPNWQELDCFFWLKDKPLKLRNIPEPFNMPDVVVFEALYDSFQEIMFSRELKRNGIPYIIIPRGSLTYQAMHNRSRWKKEIAHFLFYDKFIKEASSIQYLTKKEYEDSKYRFDGRHFVIPNGFTPPVKVKNNFSIDAINAVFIGRFDSYHKGLDMLVEVCERQQEILREKHFVLNLYGTMTEDWYTFKEDIEGKRLDDFVKLHGPVNGKEKEDVLLSSDLFIMTSRFEGHPMGLIEALAYGVPVIASRGTNMYDEIQASDSGWVCEPEVSSIENAILMGISERERLSEKSNNAKKLSKEYDWAMLASRFHQELKAIIG